MAKLVNLARMTTATTGTGTIALGAAVSGYLTFAQAGVQNGDVVDYAVKDGNNSEIGTGTYTSAGTTLTRTVTNSTNSNAAINLSGAAEVFITPRAQTLNDAALLSTGTLLDARLSSNVPLKNAANTFTANQVVNADLYSYRAGGTTGVIFLSSPGDKYLYNNGSRYQLVSQGLEVGGDVLATNTAKKWVSFDANGSILNSFGISSVSHPNTGEYTINFSAAFASATYCTVGVSSQPFRLGSFSTSSATAFCFTLAGNNINGASSYAFFAS